MNRLTDRELEQGADHGSPPHRDIPSENVRSGRVSGQAVHDGLLQVYAPSTRSRSHAPDQLLSDLHCAHGL